MKSIRAFLKSFKVSPVIENLRTAGAEYICVIDELGALKFIDKLHSDYSMELGEKVSKISVADVICENEKVDEFVDIIKKYGHTGNPGDGIIIIENIERYETI